MKTETLTFKSEQMAALVFWHSRPEMASQMRFSVHCDSCPCVTNFGSPIDALRFLDDHIEHNTSLEIITGNGIDPGLTRMVA